VKVLNSPKDAHAKAMATRKVSSIFGVAKSWRRDVPTYQYRCKECGKSFERTETISEHENAKVRCPKCNTKKVTQVPGRVYVVTTKKS